jgi:hypothetical protein
MEDYKKQILINQIKWKEGELQSAEDALRFWKKYKNLNNAGGYAKHYESQVRDCEKQLEVLKRRLDGGDI